MQRIDAAGRWAMVAVLALADDQLGALNTITPAKRQGMPPG